MINNQINPYWWYEKSSDLMKAYAKVAILLTALGLWIFNTFVVQKAVAITDRDRNTCANGLYDIMHMGFFSHFPKLHNWENTHDDLVLEPVVRKTFHVHSLIGLLWHIMLQKSKFC